MTLILDGEQVGVVSVTHMKALRQCNKVSFHHANGGARIVCTKEVKSSGPYEDREKSCEFRVQSRVYCYAPNDFGTDVTKTARCFAMTHNYDHSPNSFGALLGLLRAGDELRLYWCGDGLANGYLRGVTNVTTDHGQYSTLHGDYLEATIHRNGEHKYTVRLETSLCPDNTARMVRPNGF